MKDKYTIQFNKTPKEVLQTRQEKRELTPEQQEYQDRMMALKLPRPPVGGAPPVSIPPLDAEPIEGFKGSIAQQATILRDPTNPHSPFYDPQLALNKGPLAPLPPEAAENPSFVRGVGSMYAANQPQLAKQVVQQGAQHKEQRESKAEEPYRPPLSKETQESLKALALFHSQAQRIQETTMEEKKDEERAAATSKKTEKPAEERTSREFLQEFKALLDNQQQWDALNNPARRKEIESRLKPMDIADVLLYGEVRQEVPIRTGDKPLVITYRSVSAEEDLAVKRMMFGETGGDRYLLDKFAVMQLTLGLVAINGEPLPDHMTEDKKFSEELFKRKYEKVVKFPIQFIADLGIQYQWFDERVRNLFVETTDAIKNS